VQWLGLMVQPLFSPVHGLGFAVSELLFAARVLIETDLSFDVPIPPLNVAVRVLIVAVHPRDLAIPPRRP